MIAVASRVERRAQTRYTRIMRTLLFVVALAACGGRQTPSDPAAGSGSGSGSSTTTAQTLLSFSATGYAEGSAPKSKLYLEVTNQNGAMQSYPIGEVEAPCQPGAGNGKDIVTTIRCDVSGTGAELRAVYRGVDIIVLRRNYLPTDDPADVELSFREVMRLAVPPGTSVKPAS